jgi:hypothetical protein
VLDIEAPAGGVRGYFSRFGGFNDRFVLRALIVVAATLGIVFAQVAPASATVHEIVGQWCSGQDPLNPPGISDDTKRNFAQPLNASGFVQGTEDFIGSAGPGQIINFNFDNPNVKVVPIGEPVVIWEIPDPDTGALVPLYLQPIQPDPSFPAFQHCPRLAG